MNNLRTLLKSKLARRMVIYILLISSSITLFFVSLQIYLDYRSGMDSIREDVEQVISTSKKSLEENLWLLNIGSINLLLEGILQNRNIVYLEISDENGGLLTSRGIPPVSNFRSYKVPLKYRDHNRTVNLGTFTIYSTMENVYTDLINTIKYILFSQTLKTLLVSGFIIFIVWQLITRHLTTIQRYTSQIKLGNPQKDLDLGRRSGKWSENDEFSNLVNSINMMRREIYDAYSRIKHLSLHDPLTNLPNRRLLEERMKQEAESCSLSRQYGAMLFIDLDHFKLLNDSLGHSIGDQILVAISERLSASARENDLVARIGGDEFIILLSRLSDNTDQVRDAARKAAQRIQSCIGKSIFIDGKKYKISASIGIAVFGREKCSCETLLKQADNALHESKAQGRNRITLFAPEMQKRADHHLQIAQKLHVAIQQHQFVMHYQPKYNRDAKICSAEALVRWHPPGEEPISPGLFIPIAEESGLIVDIGNQITSQVFRMVSENLDTIRKSNLDNISINVSTQQFIDPGFPEHLVQEVERYQLDPGFFILEITEEAMVRDLETTIDTMKSLKRKGFRLSIDDFGTGYSSLRYLKDFPLDELKIDKSFIDHIVDNRNDLAIATSIVEMAKNLELDVIAEGVEKREQLEILLDINCHAFQGFYFSPPLKQQSFIELLISGVS